MWRLFAATLTLVLLSHGSVALAARSPESITVTPALQQISLPKSGAPVRFTAQISNNTSRSITLALSAEDFTYLNQQGALRFISPSATNAHGLASAIDFDNELVRLSPGQTTNVSLTITSTNRLASGGHYTAVLYRQVDPTNANGNTIGVKPAVATLLFATTEGQGTIQLDVAAPVANGLVTSAPPSFDVVFADTGNTQTAVHGIVQVFGQNGQLLSQGVINVDSSLILPGAQRLFSVALASQSSRPWWPGVYQVQVLYRHDGQTTYSRYVQTVFYIDGKLLALLGTLLLVCGVLALRRFGPARFYLLRR